MQMQTPAVSNSQPVMSKRQQRAAKREEGNIGGRPVTPEPANVKKEITPVVTQAVYITNNKEMGELRERIKQLEAEKAESVKIHQATVGTLKARLEKLEDSQADRGELLANLNAEIEKNRLLEMANNVLEQKMIETCFPPQQAALLQSCISSGEMSLADVVVQQKALPLASDTSEKPRGIPFPTVHDLRSKLDEYKKLFKEYRALHEVINTFRDDMQKIMANKKLSVESKTITYELRTDFVPFGANDEKKVTWLEIDKKWAEMRPQVMKAVEALKSIYQAGSYDPIPAEHVRSTAKINQLAMVDVELNKADYDKALKACKDEHDKIDCERDGTDTRMWNALDHLAKIKAEIEPRGWFRNQPSKYPELAVTFLGPQK